jgi:hypothetical protein
LNVTPKKNVCHIGGKGGERREMARPLGSETDTQRTLYAFYGGREDRETGREHPKSPREYSDGIKGSMKYHAYYSVGYYEEDPEGKEIADAEDG